MPDTEQVVVEEAAAPTTPGVVIEETPADQEGATPTIPKPRFDEVLNRAKAAERDVQDLRARVQTLERPAAPATPAQPIPTLEQVQTAYDRGQLTEGQKDQWLVYFAEERAAQKMGRAFTQVSAMTRAQATSDEYLRVMPTLSDFGSKEFKALSETYAELMGEGHPHGVETQAKALRMTFGPVRRVTESAPDHTRERADTFLEGSGGGGRMATETNPLKDVSERQIAYWKKQGLTKAQMVKEASFQSVRSLSDYRRVTAKKT